MKGECQGGKHLRQREAERTKCKGPRATGSPPVNQEKKPLSLGKQPLPGPRIWPADYGLPIRSPYPLSQALVWRQMSSHTKLLLGVGARDLEERQAGRLVQLNRREARTERMVSSNLNLKRLVI